MELLLIFAGSFTTALSGALMPGPLLTVTIYHSVKRGWTAGPHIIIGHMLLELMLVTGLFFGLAGVLKTPAVSVIIFFAGSIILFIMGLHMIFYSRSASMDSFAGKDHDKIPGPVVSGILVSLMNPYWTIWWITIGLAYMLKAQNYGIAGIIIFFAGHISADFAWYLTLSIGVSRGRSFMKDRTYRILLMLCGLFLAGFGIWFFLNAVSSY